VNGNLSQVVEDAKKLTDAVFQVYPQVLSNYSSLIGPVSTPEQQKILFDLSVTCLAIANKESRVEKFREDRKNGNNHPSPPTHPQPPQPPVKDREPMTLDDSERKPRDERDRPTDLLIQELGIRTPKQAGFLRYQGTISYKEWQRVRDEVSRREMKEAGGFTRS
jgi:hypothetical protein